VAEVERILGKSEPVQADSDNPCEAAGATRQVRCLVCDPRWDSPRWWPNGSYSVDYLVICLDDGNRVRHRFHQFVCCELTGQIMKLTIRGLVLLLALPVPGWGQESKPYVWGDHLTPDALAAAVRVATTDRGRGR